jgi:hypothetical protein
VGGTSATGQAFVASVGEPVVMLEDRHEFEHRLASVAPRAAQLARVAGVQHAEPAVAASPGAALRITRSY